MAIASTPTLLSLDRYAKLMGINPVHFNGGNQIELSDESNLFPLENAQNDIWPQYPWQRVDQVSRDELAQRINEAEHEIIQFLGYNPTPAWNVMEFVDYDHSYRDNVTILSPTIQLDKQYFISGGRRSVVLVQAGVVVGYTDLDHDGWSETAIVQFPYPAGTSLSEIKVYFAGHSGDAQYEIRDVKSKSIVGANVKIVFPTWVMVDPDQWEAYPTNDQESFSVDMGDMASFVITVDVYREYNDTANLYGEIYYHDCTSDAQQITRAGIFGAINRLSRVIVYPLTYDTTTATWIKNTCFSGDIDFVRLWYYSGKKERQIVANVDDYISQPIARAISYLATARLERIYHTNNNATALADEIRRDYMESTGSFVPSPMDLDSCPFGTKVGEYLAWKSIRNFMQRVGNYATI